MEKSNKSFDQGLSKNNSKIQQSMKIEPIHQHKEEDISEDDDVKDTDKSKEGTKEKERERESIGGGDNQISTEQKGLIQKLFYTDSDTLTLDKDEASLIKDLLLCSSVIRCGGFSRG
jgi:hypothetical protein